MAPTVDLEVVETATSTMDAARERVRTGTIRGAGLVALEQTSGRGQRGRTWSSAPGASLCVTYYLELPAHMPVNQSGVIALLAGVAAAESLNHFIGPPGAVGLKWPNDLICEQRKMGGILVEMAQSGSGVWTALAGIGTNLKRTAIPPELASEACALEEFCSLRSDAVSIARDLGARLRDGFILLTNLGERRVVERWREYDATTGRRYTVDHDTKVTGTAVGVDDAGALLVRLDSGRLVRTLSATGLREEAPGTEAHRHPRPQS